jgi:hypothetical protein
LMKVKKRQIPKWSAADVDFERVETMTMRDLYEPDLGEVDCLMLSGESPQEMGRNLAKKLLEDASL